MIETLLLGSLAVAAIASAAKKNAAGASSGGGSGSPAGYPIVTPYAFPPHATGQPCPPAPAPPAGFKYWPNNQPVPAAVSAWASHVLNTYPLGVVVQDVVNGQPVTARTEYHTWVGKTGETGVCIKGVSLFVSV
jgi:hypothetical protein